MNVGYDDRGQAISSTTHYMPLKGLKPQTMYFYQTIQNGKACAEGSFRTGASLSLPGFDAVFGTVTSFKLDQPAVGSPAIGNPAFGSHPITVTAIRSAFSTDGEEVALASRNGEVNIWPMGSTADVDGDCDLDVFDLVYLNRYLQDLSILVPGTFRKTNPSIPSDKVIEENILENKESLDVDKVDAFTIFDLVYINRAIQGISLIVPRIFRKTNPNLPSDVQLADTINSLKPQCSNKQKAAGK